MANTDLAILDLGTDIVGYDPNLVADLVKGMTAGIGGDFKRSPRLVMRNGGFWELITEDGEIMDLGNSGLNLVIIDQREFVSRIHYEKTFDEMKAEGEFLPPSCQSYDGITPDDTVENPVSSKCKDCPMSELKRCAYYRRLVAVIAYEDGTFSDPVVYEPKAKSLFDDEVVNGKAGCYNWYIKMLVSQKRNGVPMPVPVQFVVTKAFSAKADVATTKYGIASLPNGGYWVLTEEQRKHILTLKDSDEVKEMLKPFNAATNNPSSAGQIDVVMVEEETQDRGSLGEDKPEVKEELKKPVRKAPPKKKAPEPVKEEVKAKKVKMVVLGIEHPDLKNDPTLDYSDVEEWANDPETTQEDITEWLQENYPQALEPVEVEIDEPEVKEELKKPVRKAPPKKKAPESAKEEVKVKEEKPAPTVSEQELQEAVALAEGLDSFDD